MRRRGNGRHRRRDREAEEYVVAVCTEINGWVEEVQARSEQVGQDVVTETTLEGQRDVFAAFLDDVVTVTDDHLAGLRDAGVPEVEDGQQIAETLLGVFEGARAILAGARERVDELPTDDAAAFATAVEELGSGVQTALEEIGSSVTGLDSPELVAAAEDEPACAALSG
ncbi:MAG: hypothetical protein ACRDHS_09615 [Actinomycetota bacterium]